MAELTVKQVEGAEVATEVIAEAIVDIGRAMRAMETGRLNSKAIVALIHHQTGLAQSTIRTVLNSLGSLEQEYLRKRQ